MVALHKYCPRCKMVETSTTAIFCTICGTKLTQQTVCDCGEPIWGHYIHCPNCGKLFISGQMKSGGEKIKD
jgi:phage FluMu protein Com